MSQGRTSDACEHRHSHLQDQESLSLLPYRGASNGDFHNEDGPAIEAKLQKKGGKRASVCVCVCVFLADVSTPSYAVKLICKNTGILEKSAEKKHTLLLYVTFYPVYSRWLWISFLLNIYFSD